jgi:AcrR family transcriptional regulator
MGRRKTLTDQDILRRARPVFLNRGLDASTRDVAAAVGLTWAAIALRFGSKRALFEQAMEHRTECFEEPASDLADDADLGALLQWLRSQLTLRWPMYLQLNLSSSVSLDDDDNERSVGLARWLASKLRRHADRGEIRSDLLPHKLATLLLAALSGDAAERIMRRHRSDPADDALVETMLRLLDAKGL